MPIQFKIKRQRYLLPIGWEELPFWKLDRLADQAKDVNTLVKFLTDCPHQIDASAAEPFLTWLAKPLNMDDFEPSIKIGDIRKLKYGQKLKAATALRKDRTLRGIVAVVQVYDTRSTEELELLTLGELIPMYLEIESQLVEILKQENATLSIPPTAEQMRAGISEFEKLGDFNTIDDLAQGKPWKYNTVLDMDYNTAYAKLLKSKISHTFAKRYEEITRSAPKSTRK